MRNHDSAVEIAANYAVHHAEQDAAGRGGHLRRRAGGPDARGAAEELGRAGFGVDYFALVGADTMRPLGALPPSGGGPARLAAAARLGAVRLLNNVAVPPGPAARRALP